MKELHALTWWTIKLSLKIKVFMWLLTKHKTLTKTNLASKGWDWDTSCHFCQLEEYLDHLFVQCHRVRKILFWMGRCQDYIEHWHSIENMMEFAFTLPKTQKDKFLTMFSAVTWTTWLLRNNICFNQGRCDRVKTSILNVINWVLLWTCQTGNVEET